MSGMPPYDAIAVELRQIAHHEGEGIWRDRSRLMGLLLDQQPDLRREIRAVVTAIEQGVAQALTGAEPSLTAITIDRQAGLLESEANLRPDVAQDVTRAIAHALNLGPLPSIYGRGSSGAAIPHAAQGAMPIAPAIPEPLRRDPPPPQAAWDGSHSHGGSGHGASGQGSAGHSAHGQGAPESGYGQPYAHGQQAYGSHDHWGPPPPPAKSNRNLIIGTTIAGGAVIAAGIVAAVTLGGGGGSGGSDAVMSEAYLEGRWCDRASSWMTFESATKQINLPNGNTGQRVIATYALSGGTLTIRGPNGSVQTATVSRVDQQQMDMVFSTMPTERVRRC